MAAYSLAANRVARADDVRAAVVAHEAAAELTDSMTIDELLECLDGDLDFWSGLADMIGGGYLDHTYLGGACARLGVPGIAFTDGPRGVVIGDATCFPVSMARGAAWDPDLERRVGDAIGRELRAKEATFFGGVCVNLLRHPAWGRAQETYGEDPLLVGTMGAALTSGVQEHAMACVKHFALNSMENARFKVDVTVDQDVLHEVYLPHVKRVVGAGVASVMSAYNSVNGEWCGQNRSLLTDVLREQWGFAGFVISDFIFGLREAAPSVRAGLDIELPFRMIRHHHLRDALEHGEITLEEIRASVARVIATCLQFEARLAGHVADPSIVGCVRHRELAHETAARGMVLLRNEPVAGLVDGLPATALLPLADQLSLAVIGTQAAQHSLGDRGSSRVTPAVTVSLLDGLRAAPGHRTVTYDDGLEIAQAALAAAAADVAIVMVGYNHTDEGEYVGLEGSVHLQSLYPPQRPDTNELLVAAFAKAASTGGERTMGGGGDRNSLRLHDHDEQLIQAVSAANPRTVVLVVAGSAVLMPWAEQAAAIAMVWYPGQEGGSAIASVLLGEREPTGRLPLTIARNPCDYPDFDRDAVAVRYDRWHGYTKLHRDKVTAHYPFGFGLGYSTFELIDSHVVDDIVTVTVANTGARPGTHLVQVYGGAATSAADDYPEWLLCGFARSATIPPGETGVVVVPVDHTSLMRWDPDQQQMSFTPGEYRLAARSHADDFSGQVVTAHLG